MKNIIYLIITINAYLSWYDPSICDISPINCFDPENWWVMASGESAKDWFNKSLACPQEFPIGTYFSIIGSKNNLADGRYICLDRGGKIIVNPDGTIWLDLLRYTPIWHETIEVVVEIPIKISYSKYNRIR